MEIAIENLSFVIMLYKRNIAFCIESVVSLQRIDTPAWSLLSGQKVFSGYFLMQKPVWFWTLDIFVLVHVEYI